MSKKTWDVENVSNTDSDAFQTIHSSRQDTVRNVFDTPTFDYEIVGAVTRDIERASTIIEAANEYDCEHIFLMG